MTELILIRHGETDWNRQLRFQGQVDVPLNAIGLEQAHRVARRLAGERIDAVWSSDLQRARQTAEVLADALRMAVNVEPRLREQGFGCVDGLSVAEIQARHPESWTDWLRFDADYCMGGGESTRQLDARVLEALAGVASAARGGIVALVTHGGVLDMIWRRANNASLHGPRGCDIPNGGINRVRWHGDGPHARIEIVQWAQVSHLEGMPRQPVYDQKKLLATAPKPISP